MHTKQTHLMHTQIEVHGPMEDWQSGNCKIHSYSFLFIIGVPRDKIRWFWSAIWMEFYIELPLIKYLLEFDQTLLYFVVKMKDLVWFYSVWLSSFLTQPRKWIFRTICYNLKWIWNTVWKHPSFYSFFATFWAI
jgi:hypothetical protein